MNLVEHMYPLTSCGHIVYDDTGRFSVAFKRLLEGLYTVGAQVRDPANIGCTLREAMEYLSLGVDGDFPTRLLLLRTCSSQTVVFNNAWRSRGWFEIAFPLTKKLVERDVYFL